MVPTFSSPSRNHRRLRRPLARYQEVLRPPWPAALLVRRLPPKLVAGGIRQQFKMLLNLSPYPIKPTLALQPVPWMTIKGNSNVPTDTHTRRYATGLAHSSRGQPNLPEIVIDPG